MPVNTHSCIISSVDPRITARTTPSPKAWKDLGEGAETWHHMIPYAVLRDVWNGLVDQHAATQWPEARIAIRQFLSLCNRNIPDVDELLDRMREKSRLQRRDGLAGLDALGDQEVSIIEAAVVWPVWNVVGGPANRSDDPKDGDVYDQFRVGLTPEELLRVQAIEMLLAEFRFFRDATPPGQPALRRLATNLQALRPLIVCDKPIPFRPSMWMKDGAKWRKRRQNE